MLDGEELFTTTDENGVYAFIGLEPMATYIVREVQKQDWEQTYPALTADHARKWIVELAAGQIVTEKDFGNYDITLTGQSNAEIHRRFFRDSNGDGDWDPGEPPESYGVGDYPDSLSVAVAAEDLNDDGTPDLAVANGIAGTVSIMLNSVAAGSHRIALTGTEIVQNRDFGRMLDNALPTITAARTPLPIRSATVMAAAIRPP